MEGDAPLLPPMVRDGPIQCMETTERFPPEN